MKAQVWIVLFIFILQIVYSITAASISREFREISFNNKVSMGIYYFSTIVVLGILLVFGTQCAASGSLHINDCNIYAWLLAAVIFGMILFTIIRTIILMVRKNKNKKG
jgi:hypothetical protein